MGGKPVHQYLTSVRNWLLAEACRTYPDVESNQQSSLPSTARRSFPQSFPACTQRWDSLHDLTQLCLPTMFCQLLALVTWEGISHSIGDAPFAERTEINPPHLGSEMFAECMTRPQYVLRSYCEAGSSRLPGSEADMVGDALGGCTATLRCCPRTGAIWGRRQSIEAFLMLSAEE